MWCGRPSYRRFNYKSNDRIELNSESIRLRRKEALDNILLMYAHICTTWNSRIKWLNWRVWLESLISFSVENISHRKCECKVFVWTENLSAKIRETEEWTKIPLKPLLSSNYWILTYGSHIHTRYWSITGFLYDINAKHKKLNEKQFDRTQGNAIICINCQLIFNI